MTKIHATLRDTPRGVNAKVLELTRFVAAQYHSAMATERGVTCPTCRARAAWDDNPHRPFCSLTCRLIDLGVWLDERYRIPETHDSEADVP